MADPLTAPDDVRRPLPWRSWYARGLLLVVYVFNFIDRSILSILAESKKKDLSVSDTQMRFLGGVAFAMFYTFVGIPVARLADTSVRRNVVAISLAIWSAMTAVCGLVTSFPPLFDVIGRADVGRAARRPA